MDDVLRGRNHWIKLHFTQLKVWKLEKSTVDAFQDQTTAWNKNMTLQMVIDALTT